MSLERSLYARLSTDAAVTAVLPADRIEPSKISDQTQSPPWCFYSVTEAEPVGTLAGQTGLTKYHVDFDLLATDYPTARSMADAVRTSLDGYAGGQVHRSLWTGAGFQPVTEGYHATVSFEVFAYDAATVATQGGTARVVTTDTQVRICGELADCAGNPLDLGGDTLPDQANQGGQFLTTDGSSASWGSPLPGVAGNDGKVLKVSGMSVVWGFPPGVDLSDYARTDTANTFTQPQTITAPTASTTPVRVRAAPGQTAHLIKCENSAGTEVAYVSEDGGSAFRNIAMPSGAFGGIVTVWCQNPSAPVIHLRGYTAQTGDLFQFCDVDGNVLCRVTAKGGISPASMADGAAASGTLYFSTTAGRLVYKDAGGTVNNLY